MFPKNAVISIFLIICAHKFNDKFRVMQENEVKNDTITVVGYYKALPKTEKSQLIQFLMLEYGYRYSNLQQKLSGRVKFNPRDLLIISTAINQGLWRNK